ncbi:MAG: hypothetical protein JWM58_3016 [Rhizobium sp.]|nr:hypothetical protein [Rhizobium sp.]
MVCDNPGMDLHAALKACYFADKDHINEYQRPIFGATYRAMKFGPVPVEIYEMIKGEALWMAELEIDRLPWHLTGYRLSRMDNAGLVDKSTLSESEQEIFASALERSIKMDFNERTAATHSSDWQNAKLGVMKYEDMILDTPAKPEIVEYLQENARFMKL